MTPRTLRAANRTLYLSCVLMVIAACVYVLLTREWPDSYRVLTMLAGLGATVWGLYYFLLSYRVDAESVTRRTLFGSKRLLWAQLTAASLEKSDSNGVASVHINLTSPAGEMRLSSDLLTPDDVEELAAELKENGLLR